MKQNPWLGLATYDEQAVAQGYKFCGRERAIKELYSIIDNNLLTTLYGKSGIGKSSLLQAGVFPCLRSDNYLPIMIRLGIETTAEKDYASLIIEATHNAIKKIGGQCIKAREGRSTRDEERLWDFFHTTEFKDRNEEYLFPVIVLDQFEELYYKDKQQLNLLLKSLYLLVDDSSLPTTNDDDSTNYRLVLSIREDDLFHLEDSIDKLRLVEMKYNRYRLRELTDDEARDVIMRPGVALFNPAESSVIADSIIKEAKAGSEEISTAVLSLICSRIYYISQSAQSTDGTSLHIALSQVTNFFKQAEGNFLKSFYDDIVKELKSPDKWYYIEDTLVTDEGRRNSVLKSEFDKAVPNSGFLFRGEKSMLRCITTAGTDEPRVEIIHDMLARQMMSSRNERKLQEQAKALRKQRITAIAIILLAIILGTVFYTQYRSIVAERNSMLKMQSHYIAEKAEKLIEEGNLILAAHLLLNVLPKNLDDPSDRPYVAEAGKALQNIDYNLRQGFMLLTNRYFNPEELNDSSKFILTTSNNHPTQIWDAQTQELVGEIQKYHEWILHWSYIKHQFVSYWFNPSIQGGGVYDIVKFMPKENMQREHEIQHCSAINSAVFNSKGDYIVTASDDFTAKIWDVSTKMQIGETMKHDSCVNYAVFSHDGNYIVTASDDYTAKLWNAHTGEQVGEVMKHDSCVNYAAFSHDGKYIVTASMDSTAKIWDVYTGKQIGQTMKHDAEVSSAVFTLNGESVVTLSRWRRSHAKVWNAQTGELVMETLKSDEIPHFATFSHDANYIVTAAYDDDWPIKIWDTQMKREVKKIMFPSHWMDYAAINPNGNYIAISAVQDYCFRIGDRVWGVLGDRYPYHHIKIWNMCTGKQDGKIIRTNSRTDFMSFSPDGKHLVSLSGGKTAEIWNISTRRLVGETLKHDNYIRTVAFSPDGKHLVTTSSDGTAKISDFSPLQELIDKYRELFRDLPLTEEELIEYNFK